MKDFLSNNGPWDQLIKLENIELKKVLKGEFDVKERSLMVNLLEAHMAGT